MHSSSSMFLSVVDPESKFYLTFLEKPINYFVTIILVLKNLHDLSTFKLSKALKSLLAIYINCTGHSAQKKLTGPKPQQFLGRNNPFLNCKLMKVTLIVSNGLRKMSSHLIFTIVKAMSENIRVKISSKFF